MDKARQRPPEDLFLPDFCAIRTVFLVVVVAELLAFVITLAGSGGLTERLDELALVSLFVQWIALASTALLCLTRRRLARFAEPLAGALAYLGVLAVTWGISEAAWWIEQSWRGVTGLVETTRATFLVRSLGIGAIVGAFALRYFYVQHHWQRRIRSEAQARVQALTARIRPHFFFNCMNTIASLTRSHPQAAERAVEDLADLFRASLADARTQVPLAEELRLCRQYLDIERLRLGERLRIDWHTEALPEDARLPALTVQPLIENAIYHGIEPRPQGGVIRLYGSREGTVLHIVIENPIDATAVRHDGNRLAQDNVRERLQAVYGRAGGLKVESGRDYYRVTLSFPYRVGDEDPDRR